MLRAVLVSSQSLPTSFILVFLSHLMEGHGQAGFHLNQLGGVEVGWGGGVISTIKQAWISQYNLNVHICTENEWFSGSAESTVVKSHNVCLCKWLKKILLLNYFDFAFVCGTGLLVDWFFCFFSFIIFWASVFCSLSSPFFLGGGVCVCVLGAVGGGGGWDGVRMKSSDEGSTFSHFY